MRPETGKAGHLSGFKMKRIILNPKVILGLSYLSPSKVHQRELPPFARRTQGERKPQLVSGMTKH